MRKLVTVRQANSITPIMGADNIELVHIDGWQCIAKKGEFQVGDFGVYFEIDSFVPTADPRFGFLESRAKDWQGKHGAIIKTMRLRGELSQGLFLPVSSFPEITNRDSDIDWSEDLGVYKYEKEVEEPIQDVSSGFHRFIIKYLPRTWRKKIFSAYSWVTGLKSSSRKKAGPTNSFPSFLRKSDEERIQNYFNKATFQEKIRDVIFECTMKLDGSSASYYFNKGEFGLCSRNNKRGLEDGSHFAYIAKKYSLPTLLEQYGRNIQILGELMGPKIQGNRESLPVYEYYVFNIFDIDKQVMLGRTARKQVLKDLADMNLAPPLKEVPYLGEYNVKDSFPTLESLLTFAEGPSLNHPTREGVVFKARDGSFSFKVISNKFLLKEKD